LFLRALFSHGIFNDMSDVNKVATKADVAKVSDDVGKLAIATKNTFDGIEDKLTTLKKGQLGLKSDVAGLKEGQERILSIVESIDEHFKEHKELPRKVEALEVDVFKLKTQQ